MFLSSFISTICIESSFHGIKSVVNVMIMNFFTVNLSNLMELRNLLSENYVNKVKDYLVIQATF